MQLELQGINVPGLIVHAFSHAGCCCGDGKSVVFKIVSATTEDQVKITDKD